jgi:cellulose synthase/poly-beta-1,6-N-acetylglucosamine synthase-like glycosyltransferase
MQAPAPSAINHQVAAFAWRVKNGVRPLGLAALGLPCQLMGTGMAFPWEAIRGIDLASGAIVEDLKLGLDLAAAGRSPLFCPSAIVTSTFPLSRAGTDSQRERWEQGHIGLIVSGVPQLILSALKRRDFRLMALALDLAVPPVALLLMLLAAALGLTGLAALAGFSPLAFHISAAAFVAFTLAIGLAWWAQGRTTLPLGSALLLPAYLWGKCKLYARLLTGERASRWVRTDRN